MYRKPRFLKVLHTIREQMSREVDYDVDLFVEMVRAGERERPTRRVRVSREDEPIEASESLDEKAGPNKKRTRAAR